MINVNGQTGLVEELIIIVKDVFVKRYGAGDYEVIIKTTESHHRGDFTLLIFPLAKKMQKSPEIIGLEIGELIIANYDFIKEFNVVGGFLNLVVSSKKWLKQLEIVSDKDFLSYKKNDETVLIEFSSPNTNKPLHLGHLRNIFLGDSLASIFEYVGYNVKKLCVVNDRGIHICKSMLAYLLKGNNESPESAGIKGDKLVGAYYVLYDSLYKAEIAELKNKGVTDEEIKNQSRLLAQAYELLQKWEDGDEQILALWKRMNNWVYVGFEETYKKLKVVFDKIYYESETYLNGKEIVLEGLEKKIFYKREDGAICVDLTPTDTKVLMRADGTSVYITQDLGMCDLRYKEFEFSKSIYIVGDEQIYHFKTLFGILTLLVRDYANDLFHLSYGMVNLPNGRMKSREGTVVDADDLIAQTQNLAKDQILKTCKFDNQTTSELDFLSSIIGLGALRYFLLKVDSQKKLTFDPNEAIDLLGNTGPFLQYTCTRINSLLKRLDDELGIINFDVELELEEIDVIKILAEYRNEVLKTIRQLAPDIIAKYVYELCRRYNKFYAKCNVLQEQNLDKKNIRVYLSLSSLKIASKCLELLKIEIPERM